MAKNEGYVYKTPAALRAERAGPMWTWMHLKEAVEAIDLDFAKNCNGNMEAGIRARRGLRCIKDHAAYLLSMTIRRDKQRGIAKRAQKQKSEKKT